MDIEDFRRHGKDMVDYMCDYMNTIRQKRVTADVQPGFLKKLIPPEAPQKPEDWEKIMHDFNNVIIPGTTHWQHPQFHGYFPTGNSYPSIMGDMLSGIIGSLSFSWVANPAGTELETITLDWVGKAIGLPEQFLSDSENGKGGGVIQGSASECVLVSLLAARTKKLKELRLKHPFVEESVLLSRLTAYCSKESHSCVEKASKIAFVKLRTLQPDESLSLRGDTLEQAIEEDLAMGQIPVFVSTTLGTTSCCSFDNIDEIGRVCEVYNVWLHVDCAYGGSAFLCEEFRYLMKGIEYADSVNMNPNKLMLVAFDCALFWVKDKLELTNGMVVEPLYLNSHKDGIDYRHWGISLSRRFRSLKLWFVLRSYGIEGLQKYVRGHCQLAKLLEKEILADPRFEVCNQVILGLVCFRLRGQSNETNAELLSSLNATGKIHLTPSSVDDQYIIRLSVNAENCNEDDIKVSWNLIQLAATRVLRDTVDSREDSAVASRANPRRRESLTYNPLTGQSILSRVPVKQRWQILASKISRSSLDLVDLENLSSQQLGLTKQPEQTDSTVDIDNA